MRWGTWDKHRPRWRSTPGRLGWETRKIRAASIIQKVQLNKRNPKELPEFVNMIKSPILLLILYLNPWPLKIGMKCGNLKCTKPPTKTILRTRPILKLITLSLLQTKEEETWLASTTELPNTRCLHLISICSVKYNSQCRYNRSIWV